MKRLPKKFRGADVVRGKVMNAEKFDKFIMQRALFLVVENDALEDGHADRGSMVRCFSDKDDALRYARAMSAGNIDHRVLRVTDQVLVIGAHNDL
jgi:hypothetical protein